MRVRVLALVAAAAALSACGTTAGTGSVANRPAGPASTVSTVPTVSTSSSPAETGLPSLPSQQPVDACALVTKAEADALAGVRLQAAVAGPSSCTWPTPTSGATAQLEVYVGDGAKKSYDIDHDDLGHEFTDVPGVGDEAYQEDGAIFFRKGSTWVQLKLLRLDSVDTRPALVRLATIVVGRL